MSALEQLMRKATGAIAALVLLSALVGLGVSLFGHPQPVWAWFGFEVVTLVSAGLGVLFGLGRFRQGPAMTMVSIGGTIAVATLFGRLSLLANLSALAADPWVIGRLAGGGLLGLAATVLVFSRDRRCWPSFIKGALLAMPAAAAGAIGFFRPGLIPGRDWEGLLAVLRVGGLLVGGLLVCILISVGIHLIIRAFEHGRTDSLSDADKPATPPSRGPAEGAKASDSSSKPAEAG